MSRYPDMFPRVPHPQIAYLALFHHHDEIVQKWRMLYFVDIKCFIWCSYGWPWVWPIDDKNSCNDFRFSWLASFKNLLIRLRRRWVEMFLFFRSASTRLICEGFVFASFSVITKSLSSSRVVFWNEKISSDVRAFVVGMLQVRLSDFQGSIFLRNVDSQRSLATQKVIMLLWPFSRALGFFSLVHVCTELKVPSYSTNWSQIPGIVLAQHMLEVC